MASKKWLIGLSATAIIAAFAAYSYASPWLTMRSIRSAATEGDLKSLEKLVDFNRVSERLAYDVTMQTLEPLGVNPQSETAYIAHKAFSSIITTIVRPEYMAKAAQELKKRKEASPKKAGEAGASTSSIDFTGNYLDVGRFQAFIKQPGKPEEEAFIIELTRLGPLSWQADRLILPKGLKTDALFIKKEDPKTDKKEGMATMKTPSFLSPEGK